jgi:hypothetical protein
MPVNVDLNILLMVTQDLIDGTVEVEPDLAFDLRQMD